MDDVIYREDALERLRSIPSDLGRRELDDSIKAIETMPSAQQWIPCNKRLPKELVPVNVTWVNKDPEPYYSMIKDKPFTDTAVYYEGKWYWQSATCVDLLKEYGESPADDVAYGIEIVAWMPLPSPYREEVSD